jgi:hypothetical protein
VQQSSKQNSSTLVSAVQICEFWQQSVGNSDGQAHPVALLLLCVNKNSWHKAGLAQEHSCKAELLA